MNPQTAHTHGLKPSLQSCFSISDIPIAAGPSAAVIVTVTIPPQRRRKRQIQTDAEELKPLLEGIFLETLFKANTFMFAFLCCYQVLFIQKLVSLRLHNDRGLFEIFGNLKPQKVSKNDKRII